MRAPSIKSVVVSTVLAVTSLTSACADGGTDAIGVFEIIGAAEAHPRGRVTRTSVPAGSSGPATPQVESSTRMRPTPLDIGSDSG